MDEMRRLRVKKYRQVEFQMLSLRSDFLPISSWTSTISVEIMVRCGPCTFGDFKCAYVSLHFFELQHYENHVAKKYADTNNNRLS